VNKIDYFIHIKQVVFLIHRESEIFIKAKTSPLRSGITIAQLMTVQTQSTSRFFYSRESCFNRGSNAFDCVRQTWNKLLNIENKTIIGVLAGLVTVNNIYAD
jgi:hypothetical protein